MNEPKGYEYLLLCDGSTISEENYPELVAVLGGTQLPNLIGRFLQGSATAGTYKEAGLPNITGSILDNCFGHLPGGTGAIIANAEVSYNYTNSGTVINFYGGVSFDASRSSTIYGNSATVQPPAFTTKIYICYAG